MLNKYIEAAPKCRFVMLTDKARLTASVCLKKVINC